MASPLDLFNHLQRALPVDGRQSNGAITVDLHQQTTSRQGDGWPDLRVAGQADQRLGKAVHHRLHHNALDLGLRIKF